MSAQELHSAHSSIKEELEAAISSFGASEVIAYRGTACTLHPIEYYIELTNNFIEQYKNFSILQLTAYHSAKSASKLHKTKEQFQIKIDFAAKLLKNYLDELKFQKEVVLKRINAEDQYKKYKEIFRELVQKQTFLCLDLENSYTDLSIANSMHSYKSILNAIYYDFIQTQRMFQTDIFMSCIRLFPITRRNEIITRISTLLRTDLSINSAAIPSPIKNEKDIEPEMRRLSDIMKIKFDLSEYDGQKFIYECDKKFLECFSTPDVIITRLPSEYTKLEHGAMYQLNYELIHKTKTHPHVDHYLDLLLNGKSREVTEFFSTMLSSHPLMSDYPRPHAICVLSLRFARSRYIIRSIHSKCKTLYGENSETKFALIIKELKAIVTHGMKKSMSNCDFDAIYERMLELYDNYLSSKVSLMAVMKRLNEFSGCNEFIDIMQRIIDEEPDFQEGVHTTLIHNFKRQSEVIELEASLLEVVLALHMHSCSNIPLCGPAGLPSETFHTSRLISVVSRVIGDLYYVSKEILTTMSIPPHIFVYVHLAVVQEAFHEITKGHISNLTPSIAALSTVVNAEGAALEIFTSSFLNSYDDIVSFVESFSQEKRFDVAMKALQVRRYLYKLVSLVVKQSELEKAVAMQLSTTRHKTRVIDEFTINITPENIDEKLKELENAVINQRLFVMMLSETARYNSFEADARYFGTLFRADDVFLTDQPAENVVTLADVRRVLFTETFDANNFEAPLDPYQYTDTEGMTKIIREASLRAELGYLIMLERTLMSNLNSLDPFEFERPKGKKLYENQKFNPFLVPCVSDIIYSDENDLEPLRNFIAARLRLLHIAVFNGTISRGTRRTAASIAARKAIADMTIFSVYKACAEHSDVDALKMFADYNELAYAAGIISLVDECQDLSNHIDEIPHLKNAMSYILKQKYSGNFITLEKYVPWFVFNFCHYIDDDVRPLVSNAVTVIRGKSDDSAAGLSLTEVPRATSKFLEDQIKSTIAKFSFYLLQSSKDYRTITPVSGAFDVTIQEYKRNRDDFSRTIESEASRRAQSINENLKYEKLVEVILERMRPRVEGQVLANMKLEADELKALAAEPFAQPISTLKPDVYMKRPRANMRETPYIPSPSDAEKQEAGESRFAIGKFIRSVSECVDREPKDQNGIFTIDAERLKSSLSRITQPLNDFCDLSARKTVSSWSMYNTNMERALNVSVENDKLSEIMTSTVSKRLLGEIEICTKENISDKLNKLNSLRNIARLSDIERRRESKEIIVSMREEFEILYTDILAELQTSRSKYKQKKELQYKVIQEVIKKNGGFDFASVKMPQILSRSNYSELFQPDGTPIAIPHYEDETVPTEQPEKRRSSSRRLSCHANVNVCQQLITSQRDIAKLKEQVLKMRISRTFLAIAIRRKYERQIKKAEQDRVLESALYWNSRRQAEQTQQQLEQELSDCYDELSKASDTVDTLKVQHENLTKENVQLFHWKSMTMARQDRAHKAMKELTTDPNVPLQSLISQIAEKQAELDELKEETDYIEEEAEHSVREPMREVDRIRHRTTLLRTENTFMLKTLKASEPTDTGAVDDIIKENEKLREENQRLRDAIAQCGGSSDDLEVRPKSSRVPPLSLTAGRKIVKPSNAIKSARQSGVLRFK